MLPNARAAVVTIGLLAAAAAQTSDSESASESTLEIVRLDLLDRKGGYAIPADSVFYPGETVHAAFNIRGYQVTEDYRMKVRYRIDAAGPSGTPIATPEGGEFDVEIAPQDEDWEPLVNYSVKLPDHAGGGVYAIQVKVTDEIAAETVEQHVAVTVEGARVEVSDALTVRNFAFSRIEGGAPLDPPVFQPGETLWASFYITGYVTSEENAYDVESSLEILDAEGERMLAFEPKGERGSPFYPRLWLPGSFRLDLDPTIPAGSYVVVLRVKDNVGDKTHESRRGFVVQ